MAFPGSNISGVIQSDEKAIKICHEVPRSAWPAGRAAFGDHRGGIFLSPGAGRCVRALPRYIQQSFLQLFFRAWADARLIAQHDRPEADRFVAYIGSAIGIGSTPYRNLDSVPDAAKLGFAGLIGAQAKSASRTRRGDLRHLQCPERKSKSLSAAGSCWRMPSGVRSAAIIADWARTRFSGATIFSVQDKIRVRIFTKDLAQYARLLPTGDLCEPLADFIFLLRRRAKRLRYRTGHSGWIGGASQARPLRAAWLDELDGPELDLDGGLPPRCSLSSWGANEAQAIAFGQISEGGHAHG